LQRLAGACIFLAAKVEEAHVRTNDMLNAIAATAQALSPADAAEPAEQARFSCLVGDAYQAAKRQLIEDEQLVLRVMHFTIAVEQPHRYLYMLAHCWGASLEAVRMATCLLNDVMTHCPCYNTAGLPPATAATAALHIGAQLCGQAVQPAGWWQAMGIADKAMRQACSTLLGMLEDDAS
jgi:hypothetical protein